MIATELISENIPPLKHTDTGEKALQWMDEFKVRHLPVLKKQNFVGIVSEDDLLNQTDLSKELTDLFNHLPRPYVHENMHIYNVLNIAALDHITVIPVLNDKEDYMGCISAEHLIHCMAETSAIKEHGSIVIIEMNAIDYSLSHVAQIVENENARILSAFVNSDSSSNKLELTLKINRSDAGSILRALERYDYNVKISFQQNSHYDDLKDRYDELMNYLNI